MGGLGRLHHDTVTSVDGRTIYVGSTRCKPRLPGDGCGCKRVVAQEPDGPEYGVELCPRHQLEPWLAFWMLVP